MPILSSKSGWH